MGKRNVCLVINPREGQNLAKLTDILAVLAAAGYETRVVLKEYKGHTQELAHQAAEEDYDLVIAYGGDGTLNQVVNGVMDAGSRSTVGLIPGGTGNVWATEIGLPTDNPVKAALALLDSANRPVDIGHVRVEHLFLPGAAQESADKTKKREKQHTRSHFLLMAGLGLDAAVMQGTSKPLKHKIRRLAVGLAAAKELPTYRPFPLEIRDAKHNLLWQGEALQFVAGNTRLYADILHMTPEAYIDDGQLDVCVITGGNFLGTVQQVFSLLLRRKPDDVTAEYFRGARLFIKVPALVALQLDGSAVRLRSLLRKKQKQALENAEKLEEVMVEYCFDTLPQALPVAVPRSYNNALFEDAKPAEREHPEAESTDTVSSPERRDETPVFAPLLAKVREEGRKVNVVGTGFDAQNETLIVAGTYVQQSTGARKPTAVRINNSTVILNESGEKLALSAIQRLNDGQEILVSGQKNKRGVIRAEHVVI